MTAPHPIFARVPHAREDYEDFFRLTEANAIKNFSKGGDLTGLVALAEKVIHVINRCNPIWDTWEGDNATRATVDAAQQWQLDRISDVKQRIAQAIPYKQDYYENHWFGRIVKLVLKCFCLWNRGTTPAIRRAENFLLRWDTRQPLIEEGKTYRMCCFYPMTPVSAIRHLDTTHFYNYTPSRQIPVLRPLPTGLLPPNFIEV